MDRPGQPGRYLLDVTSEAEPASPVGDHQKVRVSIVEAVATGATHPPPGKIDLPGKGLGGPECVPPAQTPGPPPVGHAHGVVLLEPLPGGAPAFPHGSAPGQGSVVATQAITAFLVHDPRPREGRPRAAPPHHVGPPAGKTVDEPSTGARSGPVAGPAEPWSLFPEIGFPLPPGMEGGEGPFVVASETPKAALFQGKVRFGPGFSPQGMACPGGKNVALPAPLGRGNFPIRKLHTGPPAPNRSRTSRCREQGKDQGQAPFPFHGGPPLSRTQSFVSEREELSMEKNPLTPMPWAR